MTAEPGLLWMVGLVGFGLGAVVGKLLSDWEHARPPPERPDPLDLQPRRHTLRGASSFQGTSPRPATAAATDFFIRLSLNEPEGRTRLATILFRAKHVLPVHLFEFSG